LKGIAIMKITWMFVLVVVFYEVGMLGLAFYLGWHFGLAR
jgi:hypothetical protein